MKLPRPGRAALLVLLLAIWPAAAHARATATTPAATGFETQENCFGLFESYDQWMDFLWEKNSLLGYLWIRWSFPEADYNRYQQTLECRSVSYRSDQHLVHGWVVQPRMPSTGTLPVIVYNRGGNRALGALTFGHLFTHVFPLAEQGYLVTASQYRGAVPVTGQPSPDEFGGADIADVTRLIRIVAGLPRADAGNIFMIGQSRGAIMTFRALLESPLPVRAVAIHSGLYDLHDLLLMRPGFEQLFHELIPGYRRQPRAELDRRSVTRWAARLPPATGVLLIHGEADERAPVSSARRFAAQLQALGHPHKAIFYPGESHFLRKRRKQAQAETLRWFEAFRKRAPAAPPLAPRRR